MDAANKSVVDQSAEWTAIANDARYPCPTRQIAVLQSVAWYASPEAEIMTLADLKELWKGSVWLKKEQVIDDYNLGGWVPLCERQEPEDSLLHFEIFPECQSLRKRQLYILIKGKISEEELFNYLTGLSADQATGKMRIKGIESFESIKKPPQDSFIHGFGVGGKLGP